jgi:hypothetical protein
MCGENKWEVDHKFNFPGHHIFNDKDTKYNVTEGKIRRGIDVKGRRGRRRQQLMDNLKEKW